ncbi:MAG: ABC transporter ATP-binding protein [candidate division WOR-3 bacterium]|nr:ABC transporter ATP-binding protein [candidate division WOR-3 bacterium]
MELAINSLSKTYPNGVQALKNVSLNISTGMFGLLGPNGAGKSTLMRTIATLQEADEGTIQLNGIDVLKEKHKVRELLGYLPQEFGIYPEVTAEHMLDHIAVLKGIHNKKERKTLINDLLHQTNLWDLRRTRLGEFSGGTKQRFGIAQALLGNPQLVIVDEPTAGLDPQERNRFHNILSEIGEHVVVILSTHIVDDVSELCTNMAIIHEGELLLTAEPLKAMNELKGKIWSKVISKKEFPEYGKKFEIVMTRLFAGKIVIHVLSDNRPDDTFKMVEPELEDVYFTTINKNSAPVTA